MMRAVSLRVEVSESPLLGVSCIPRFSRHFKCLSHKVILSGVQNFVIAIGKPIALSNSIGFGIIFFPWLLYPKRFLFFNRRISIHMWNAESICHLFTD